MPTKRANPIGNLPPDPSGVGVVPGGYEVRVPFRVYRPWWQSLLRIGAVLFSLLALQLAVIVVATVIQLLFKEPAAAVRALTNAAFWRLGLVLASMASGMLTTVGVVLFWNLLRTERWEERWERRSAGPPPQRSTYEDFDY